MPLSSQTLIVENFVKLTHSLQPYETGGVLNYLFEPVTNATTSEVLLKTATFNSSTIKSLVSNTFLNSGPTFRVFDVLPAEVRPTETGGSNYLLFLAVGAATFLITLALVIATLIIPCLRQRSGSKSKGGKTSYIALGISTLVLLVFAVLCFIFAYLAFDYVAKGVGTSSDTPSGNYSGLRQTLNFLFNETKQLLQEVPGTGRRITNSTLHSVQDSVFKELGFLIPDILDQLLVAYKARDLLDLAREFANGRTGKTINYILSEQGKLVLGIQWFQGNMSEYQKVLNESLITLCPNLPTEDGRRRCRGFTNQLNLYNVNFNTGQLLTEPSKALSDIAVVFGTNMTQLAEKFINLDGKVRKQADTVLAQVRGQLDLQKQFQPLLSIWDNLSGNVLQPVVGQLDKLQPTVDSATKTVANVMPIVGYVLCVIYTLFFVVIIVFLVLIVLEAKKRDLLDSDSINDPKGTPRKSKNLILLGQCLPLFAIVIVPILVVLGAILISVVGVLNNEGCRYVERDTSIRITDAALNLYLKYTWPKLIAEQSIDPEVISLLELPVPQNVYSGLRFTCQKSTNSSAPPGLLPSVGLNNVVNVSAVVHQPEVQRIINDSEKTLIDEILKLNFSDVLSSNLAEFLRSVENITNNLKYANYSSSVDLLRRPIVDVEGIRNYLNQLRQMVSLVPGEPAEVTKIKKTADDTEVTLGKLTQLRESANRLADAFDTLWKSDNLTVQLDKLNSTLSDAQQILNNQTAIVEPVRSVYRKSLQRLSNNLTRDLEQMMTRFTTNVLPCDRLNAILVSLLSVACGSSGILNRIGAYMFMVLLLACPLVLTALLFQLFLRQHQRLCLNPGN
ncbi:uncharacterized protein DEA37_0010540 [Paragonimus westermani]|uniref:Prominin n=1 Tax=Paragonimus westermani TaxID=34504 RepID=A0A5J4NH11_9TREM|nr:uncharacterized protein DEA37_0010540 [Paragonimus westermani]